MADHDQNDEQTLETEAVPEETEENEGKATVMPEADAVANINEPLLRLQADFQNFKRRSAEDQLRGAATARLGVILELLPVIDNFQRAFADVPGDIAKSPWYGGVEAIKQQFEGVLDSLGIAKIKTVGAEFDPTFHEAISHEPHPKYAENVVSEEFEAGYRVGEDVIRHARVKVSSRKA